MEKTTYVNRMTVPLELLVQIADAAPRAMSVVGVDARELVRVLASHTETRRSLTGQDGVAYWIMSLKELTAAYSEQTGCNDVKPASVGRLLTGMGLQSYRVNTGYRAIWNRTQIDLLKKHFNV